MIVSVNETIINLDRALAYGVEKRDEKWYLKVTWEYKKLDVTGTAQAVDTRYDLTKSQADKLKLCLQNKVAFRTV